MNRLLEHSHPHVIANKHTLKKLKKKRCCLNPKPKKESQYDSFVENLLI